MPGPIASTMQDDFPLTLRLVLEHGRKYHPRSAVATFEGRGSRRATFAEIADRAGRLAAALRRLGVGPGDRVATFAWNTQEHLEAYLAVPCMGAVLHTLNIRLFPDQLAYIVNHAEDRVILVDDCLLPLLARVAPRFETVERYVVIGGGDASALGDAVRYEELLAAERAGPEWPELDERAPAAMCYTTGTTGDPKGVVYSHRSMVLHTFGILLASAMPIAESDRALAIVPMFHAMCWGLSYAAWAVGADLVMPGKFLQAEPLARMIELERPTYAAAVPTIWNDLLRWAETHPVDLSSLKLVACGGAAVPRSLIERYRERHGVSVIQGWGMTETSPVGALSWPPPDSRPEEEAAWRAKTGRPLLGIEARLVGEDGGELPWDGASVGEIEVRGPWVTASYFRDPAPEKFRGGWLRTGDVGTVDPRGYIQITDRAKDVIKSGGEWISSVELENAIMGHPDVAEAAVVGVPDERWDERPLACVVLGPGREPDPRALSAFLASEVARWWVPERWAFLSEIPKTSVGKFDKRALRSRFSAGDLEVLEVEGARRGA